LRVADKTGNVVAQASALWRNLSSRMRLCRPVRGHLPTPWDSATHDMLTQLAAFLSALEQPLTKIV